MDEYANVIAAGDYLKSLEATRDQIARDLQQCEAMRDKAALYLRLADVLARIEEAKPQPVRGDAVDEIAARRSARRTGAPESQARS